MFSTSILGTWNFWWLIFDVLNVFGGWTWRGLKFDDMLPLLANRTWNLWVNSELFWYFSGIWLFFFNESSFEISWGFCGCTDFLQLWIWCLFFTDCRFELCCLLRLFLDTNTEWPWKEVTSCKSWRECGHFCFGIQVKVQERKNCKSSSTWGCSG